MPKNDAFVITIAYPETVVLHAREWYSKFLRFIFIGNKNYVRAGHAALVLIDKKTGVLEYYDFGRYITPSKKGRVRGRETDFELNFPIKAIIKNNTIENLEEILKFLASNPKLTHGEGTLYTSVSDRINYALTKQYIKEQQKEGFVRYAAFIGQASNCARFVTEALIQGTTDTGIKTKLIKSKSFTPSTISNVVLADTEDYVYKVSTEGKISKFTSSVGKENRRLFFDTLRGYKATSVGTLESETNLEKKDHAQWLGGIGSGAWFEIYDLGKKDEYRFRRVSNHGSVDCDGIYQINDTDFNINLSYSFLHDSNCGYFHIEQNGKQFRFEYLRDY